jgi:hypothetical protein
VNEQPVTSEGPSVEIRSGSNIRLGSRLLLRFDEVVIPIDGYVGTRRDFPIPEDIIRKNESEQ